MASPSSSSPSHPGGEREREEVTGSTSSNSNSYQRLSPPPVITRRPSTASVPAAASLLDLFTPPSPSHPTAVNQVATSTTSSSSTLLLLPSTNNNTNSMASSRLSLPNLPRVADNMAYNNSNHRSHLAEPLVRNLVLEKLFGVPDSLTMGTEDGRSEEDPYNLDTSQDSLVQTQTTAPRDDHDHHQPEAPSVSSSSPFHHPRRYYPHLQPSSLPQDNNNEQTPLLSRDAALDRLLLLGNSNTRTPKTRPKSSSSHGQYHFQEGLATISRPEGLVEAPPIAGPRPSITNLTPIPESGTYETPIHPGDDPPPPPQPSSIVDPGGSGSSAVARKWSSGLARMGRELQNPSTWIGSFMFLLFQVVFCLALAASITRPHHHHPAGSSSSSSASMLGLFAKMATVGIFFGVPSYWYSLATDIPAMYPTVDLFLAPFLAKFAAIVDEELYLDAQQQGHDAAVNDDVVFLATFTTLASISMILSGTLMILASVFKLANLGSFLPFPVLCGFFSAVGVLTWTLAFKVDSNGLGVGVVFFSGDVHLIMRCLIHHVPSVAIAVTMKILGPKHPFFVVGLVCATVILFYATMWATGLSHQEMVDRKWFWSQSDLHYQSAVDGTDQQNANYFAPPYPCGWIYQMLLGNVHWRAVYKGMETAAALSFLYLIRCSLHGAALKKNVPNLIRTETIVEVITAPEDSTVPQSKRLSTFRLNITPKQHQRKFSEVIDIEHLSVAPTTNASGGTTVVRAKPTNMSLKQILIPYGYSQYLCALTGGFAVVPAISVSAIMYALRAEHVAPQLGSVLLLVVFYLNNFSLVSYIPKPAFSSLLVVAFIDMTSTWFVKSYFKTKEKMEWLVVPIIVVLAFVFGLLNAVFLGIAMSTFLFVASFFRSGVVKYVANGINIRSTIERPMKISDWLDRFGDLIQILVLQNYLFFGNASSILSYISSMFEEPDTNVDPAMLPPLPKVIVLDLTLVTGMDTSAVDVFADIRALCEKHSCKLFLSGVANSLRQVMHLGGVRPDITSDRASRRLRFFPSLDDAIGKAEDTLLETEGFEQESCQPAIAKDGFRQSLRQIDEQHQTTCMRDLIGLRAYTKPVDLEPGNILYEDQELERGLFFIERGIMKIESNADYTLSRVGSEAFFRLSDNNGTLTSLHARSGSLGREIARRKRIGLPSTVQNFRVARVGPGWVLGSTEAVQGNSRPGRIVAVTQCRLHYVPFSTIEDLEEKDSLLVLKLYKLLSFLLTKRQELTICQLGMLHSIMSSPAQKRPLSRVQSSHLRSATSSLYN